MNWTGKDVFKAIFKERVEIFINAFSLSSKKLFYNPEKKNRLHHPGEFGTYREKIVSNFLELFTPQRLKIENGFIIAPNKKVSKQIDLVVYGKADTPLIKSEEGQKFFPIESLALAGEVKSDLGKDMLKKELNNLVQIKKIRESIKGRSRVYSLTPHLLHITTEHIQELLSPSKPFPKSPNGEYFLPTSKYPYNPKIYPQDQIGTFLICNKLAFDFDQEKIHELINNLYDENAEERHKVDFLLSIEDGFIGYYNKKSKIFSPFPNYDETKKENYNKLEFVLADKNHSHCKQFVQAYSQRIGLTSILNTEIGMYLI